MFNAVMFHHFHGKKHPETIGSLSKKELYKIIKHLKKNYNLLNADQFLNKSKNNSLCAKDVCLTFDDNLKCQYDVAYPVLKKEKISAFFFIYSSIFDKKSNPMEVFRDFSNKKFKKIIDFHNLFFSTFEKLFKKKFLKYKKNYNNNYLKEYSFYSSSDRRYRFARDIILEKKEYEKVMTKMIDFKKYNVKKNHKKLFMSVKHLSTLIKNKNLIGLHSHNHNTNIKKMSQKQQLSDYKKNFYFIKKYFGKKPLSASYPFGRYNSQTLKIMKHLGIRVAFLSKENNKISNLKIGRIDHVNMIKKIK